jgi:hypothetical protein
MPSVAVIRCNGCGVTQYVPLAQRPRPFEPCADCDGWREIVRIISERRKADVPVSDERREP